MRYPAESAGFDTRRAPAWCTPDDIVEAYQDLLDDPSDDYAAATVAEVLSGLPDSLVTALLNDLPPTVATAITAHLPGYVLVDEPLMALRVIETDPLPDEPRPVGKALQAAIDRAARRLGESSLSARYAIDWSTDAYWIESRSRRVWFVLTLRLWTVPRLRRTAGGAGRDVPRRA